MKPRKPKVEFDVFYPHPPERVWRALTDPAALAKWFLPGDFAPKPGHRFDFQTASEEGTSHIACEVLEAEEPSHLAYTWQTGPEEPPTLVRWTLEPVEGGTRVRLEHSGAGIPAPLSARLFAGGSASRRRSALSRTARKTFRRRPARVAKQAISGGILW